MLDLISFKIKTLYNELIDAQFTIRENNIRFN